MNKVVETLTKQNGFVSAKDGYRFRLLTEDHAADVDAAVAAGKVERTAEGLRLVPQIGMGATVYGYSDTYAYEIVEISESGKTITLREMRAERDPTWTPNVIPGGFAGHCVNNREQRWTLTPNPEGRTTKARLTKGGRYTIGGRAIGVGQASMFYDYNF